MKSIEKDKYQDIRDAVRSLCSEFDDKYHRKIDEAKAYPEEFVNKLTKAGWLAALIPEEFGGSGLGLTEASIIMEEINRSGGNSGACHGQMYNMNTLLRHGSDKQKEFWLPRIATGEWRLQSMGVTEPTAGTDTTRIKTTACKKRRPVCDKRTKSLDFTCSTFRLDDSSGSNYSACKGKT